MEDRFFLLKRVLRKSAIVLPLIGAIALYYGGPSALLGVFIGTLGVIENSCFSTYFASGNKKKSVKLARALAVVGFTTRFSLLALILFLLIKVFSLNTFAIMVAFLITHTILLFSMLSEYIKEMDEQIVLLTETRREQGASGKFIRTF